MPQYTMMLSMHVQSTNRLLVLQRTGGGGEKACMQVKFACKIVMQSNMAGYFYNNAWTDDNYLKEKLATYVNQGIQQLEILDFTLHEKRNILTRILMNTI